MHVTYHEANSWLPTESTQKQLPVFDLLLYPVQAMPESRGTNTYTCTCTRFCGGYKTGLSRATFYRHSPYRDTAQPTSSFSSSFQNFLDNSVGDSGSGRSGLGQEESQGDTDDLETDFPTSPQVLDGTSSTRNFEEPEAAEVSFSF
jgi:hypothetical protein